MFIVIKICRVCQKNYTINDGFLDCPVKAVAEWLGCQLAPWGYLGTGWNGPPLNIRLYVYNVNDLLIAVSLGRQYFFSIFRHCAKVCIHFRYTLYICETYEYICFCWKQWTCRSLWIPGPNYLIWTEAWGYFLDLDVRPNKLSVNVNFWLNAHPPLKYIPGECPGPIFAPVAPNSHSARHWLQSTRSLRTGVLVST